jgi:hypothetical protein
LEISSFVLDCITSFDRLGLVFGYIFRVLAFEKELLIFPAHVASSAAARTLKFVNDSIAILPISV